MSQPRHLASLMMAFAVAVSGGDCDNLQHSKRSASLSIFWYLTNGLMIRVVMVSVPVSSFFRVLHISSMIQSSAESNILDIESNNADSMVFEIFTCGFLSLSCAVA